MRLRRLCCALTVATISWQCSVWGADSSSGTVVSGSGGSNGSTGTLILPHGPAAKDLRQIHRDREEIREDRTNIRFDERLIQRDRQDIRAAEHDIKINPQNTAADQARISTDRNAIGAARSDIGANRQDIRKDQHNEQHTRQQLPNSGRQQLSGQKGVGGSNESNGFFGPMGASSRTHATFGRHHEHPGNAGLGGNMGSGSTGTGMHPGHSGTTSQAGHRR